MEKDRIMCEVVQNSLKAGDPRPDDCPLFEHTNEDAHSLGDEDEARLEHFAMLGWVI